MLRLSAASEGKVGARWCDGVLGPGPAPAPNLSLDSNGGELGEEWGSELEAALSRRNVALPKTGMRRKVDEVAEAGAVGAEVVWLELDTLRVRLATGESARHTSWDGRCFWRIKSHKRTRR